MHRGGTGYMTNGRGGDMRDGVFGGLNGSVLDFGWLERLTLKNFDPENLICVCNDIITIIIKSHNMYNNTLEVFL